MDKSILVVEDSPTQAEQLRYLLQGQGYRVEVAGSGEEGLGAARANRPDLVVSAIVMPLMDGFEMCHAIKQDEVLRDVPVMLLTVLLDSRDIIKGLQAGADYYLTKPYDPAYLLSRVEFALEGFVRAKGEEAKDGLEVIHNGDRYVITSGREQMLNLLLSTYENSVQQNRELVRAQNELRALNEPLEERVKERTRQLQALNEQLEERVEERTQQLALSEANYRTLLERNEDAMVVVDRGGLVRFANPAAEALVGREMAELLGEPIDLLDVAAEASEVEVTREDGGLSIADVRVVETEWEGEKAYLATLRDITEKRRMEGGLLRAQKLESLGALAGGIAHDFNNYLTGVLVNLGLAKTAAAPDTEIFERLTAAHRITLQARQLSQHLLTFAKGGEPIKQTGRISRIVENMMGFALSGSSVECDWHPSKDLWLVDFDAGQLSQAFGNVIMNAREAMDNRGKLEITAENVMVGAGYPLPLAGGEYVRISFKDHGCGIEKDILSKVFDPYFSTKSGRDGMGLPITHSIVQRHGGYVHVKSKVGVGTEVQIYLPASERRSAVEGEKGVRESPNGGARVLLMDDESIIRDAIGIALRCLGYEVTVARDGAEAVVQYGEARESGQPFAAVILDLTVRGGMGGREAFEILHEMDPGVKAIVSSGYSDDPIMARYREYGFRGVVAKPYETDQLAKVLREVIMEGEG